MGSRKAADLMAPAVVLMTLLVMQFKEGQSHAGVVNVQQEKLPPVRITSATTITSCFILSRRHIVALSISRISASRKTCWRRRGGEGPFHHLACGGCRNECSFPCAQFFSLSTMPAGSVTPHQQPPRAQLWEAANNGGAAFGRPSNKQLIQFGQQKGV